MNNGMSGNSMGRGNSRPRGTSGRGRGIRHDFYNNSKFYSDYMTIKIIIKIKF